MIEPGRRARVLLVGAGRRIQNNYLPALTGMDDLFEIVGVHSRTPERLRPVAEGWNVRPVYDLADVDYSEVDIVSVSVPTAQNAVVMRALLPHAAGLDLVLDTPVASTRAEAIEQAALAGAFSRVSVTEDYMNFPKFELVRDAARLGLIGRPTSLTLNNIGYRYHGLALVRSFTGFADVVEHTRLPIGSAAEVSSYRFSDGFSGHVVGPYRRHTTGGLLLEGERGAITEFPVDAALFRGKPTYVLSPVTGPSGVEGHKLSGPGSDMTVDLPLMRAMRTMRQDDKSDMNLERGCGLAQVFLHVLGRHTINRSYGLAHAWYDSFATGRAPKKGASLGRVSDFTIDALTGERPAATTGPTRWIASVPTFLKKSLDQASTLPPEDRRHVEAGTEIVAQVGPAKRNHLELRAATLAGEPLEGTWYVSAPAWTERPAR